MSTSRAVRSPTLEMAGGLPCLDFVNTVGWRNDDEPEERLGSYVELVDWSERTGILSRKDSARLRRLAVSNDKSARRVLSRARQLRETLYRLLTAFRIGRAPGAADLEEINKALSGMPPRRKIACRGVRFSWAVGERTRLEAMLWPILWSAADLLVEDQPERVKMCAGDGCGWLFYDTSRNRSRRWCSMSDCGNRAKARRHYERSKRVRR